jgi:hypothetical protein
MNFRRNTDLLTQQNANFSLQAANLHQAGTAFPKT